MKNFPIIPLLVLVLCIGSHQDVRAQVRNLTVNGFSSDFTIVQGDSLEWQYNLPIGGTARGEAWYDVNGNGLIDSAIDFQPFDLGNETDGALREGGDGDKDGLVNGHFLFLFYNVSIPTGKYIFRFTNNNASTSITGRVTALSSPAFTISGRVTPPPHVNARYIFVGAEWRDGEGFSAELTDSVGNYALRFSSSNAGTRWRVRLGSDGRPPFSASPQETTFVLTQSFSNVNFVYSPPVAKVYGYLTGEDGHVLANAQVESDQWCQFGCEIITIISEPLPTSTAVMNSAIR